MDRGIVSDADLYRLWLDLAPSLSTLPLYLGELAAAFQQLAGEVRAPAVAQVDTSRLEALVGLLVASQRQMPPAPAEEQPDWGKLTGAIEKLAKRSGQTLSVIGGGGGATDATLERLLEEFQARNDVVNAEPTTITQVSDGTPVTICAPSTGQKLKVVFLNVQAAANNASPVVFSVRLGTDLLYTSELIASQPFQRSAVHLSANANDTLTLTPSGTGAYQLYVNVNWRDAAP